MSVSEMRQSLDCCIYSNADARRSGLPMRWTYNQHTWHAEQGHALALNSYSGLCHSKVRLGFLDQKRFHGGICKERRAMNCPATSHQPIHRGEPNVDMLRHPSSVLASRNLRCFAATSLFDPPFYNFWQSFFDFASEQNLINVAHMQHVDHPAKV